MFAAQHSAPSTLYPLLPRLVTGFLVLTLLTSRSALATPADDLLKSLSNRARADVNDFAGILSPAEEEALEARCRQLRERTGAQLAVVVLRSLEGGEVNDFTNKLFRLWGIGDKEKKNGVMLLVAIDDRKARIEPGYGLEGVLPDALCGRILQEQLVPHFREQRYAQGLTATADRIAEIIERNEPANIAARGKGGAPGRAAAMLIEMLFVFFSSFFLGLCVRRRQFGAALILLLFPCVGLFLGLATGLPSLNFVLLIACAIGGAILGYHSGKRSGRRPWRRRTTWPPVIMWPSTSWNSWGSGSSSWGGGFSGGGGGGWGGFGGGSSGGGGASTSW